MKCPGIIKQRMAHRVTNPEARETFEYLAKEVGENKARLHQCLTPEGCQVGSGAATLVGGFFVVLWHYGKNLWKSL
jgi:hypothetical protein